MNATVPASSIACMAIAGFLSFALPIALFIYLRKKGAEPMPFFVGCGVFLVFALILEGAVNNLLLLHTRAGGFIQSRLGLFALFGGLMAGLFEETGRFLAFRLVLTKQRQRDVNALMYGAGHGGFEAMVLLGLTSVSNIVCAVLINSGALPALTSGLPQEALAQVEAVAVQLTSLPSWQFLLGALERVFALALHMSLSVLVWAAAKDYARFYLFPLAMGLHLLVDGVVILLSGWGLPGLSLEGIVGLMSVGVALLAVRVWRRNCRFAA